MKNKCQPSANIILHNITSLHHLHSITSYIIVHQQRKKGGLDIDIRRLFWRNSDTTQKIAIEELYLRQTMKWEDLLIIDFTRIGYWFYEKTDIIYEAWKEGKVFFRRRLKNGMYIKFHASLRTELQTIHILHSNL